MKKLLGFVSVLALLLWSAAAFASDCIDLELWAEVVQNDPVDILDLHFSIENCGTEPGMANLTVTVTNGVDVYTAPVRIWLPAGEPFVADLNLPIPAMIPAGTYGLCVSATLGMAVDRVCANIVIDNVGNVIGFTINTPLPVEETTWGAIKATYR